MSAEVVWVFSLPRSGSSVTAYAAAAAFGVPVADEVFGPWDRTGTPYNYPRVQHELVRIYLEDRCYFTPRVLELAEELFEILGGRVGRVVVKHPHLRPFPHNFREARPDDGAVWLLRSADSSAICVYSGAAVSNRSVEPSCSPVTSGWFAYSAVCVANMLWRASLSPPNPRNPCSSP